MEASPPWRLEGEIQDHSDESALIAAAREEPAAFGVLYRHYLPAICRYLRARVGSEEDAAIRTPLEAALAADQLLRDEGRVWVKQIVEARLATVEDERDEQQALGRALMLDLDPDRPVWQVELADLRYEAPCDAWSASLTGKLADPSLCGRSRLVVVIDALTRDTLTVREPALSDD